MREFVHQRGLDATGSPYFRAECFLLWALPLSFIVPAIWREAWPVEIVEPVRFTPDEP